MATDHSTDPSVSESNQSEFPPKSDADSKKIEQLEKALANLKNINTSLTEENSRLQKEINTLNEKNEYIIQQSSGYVKEIAGLKKENQELRTYAAEAKESANHTVTDYINVQVKLVESQAKIKELESGDQASVETTARKRALSNSDSKAPKRRRKSHKAMHVVSCTGCYINRWQCDEGQPCQNCVLANGKNMCARVKCTSYAKGTCKKHNCGLAHEEDGYDCVIDFRRMKQRDAGPSPVDRKGKGK